MIYYMAAVRSVLKSDEMYLALQQMQPLGSYRKLLKGVPDSSMMRGCSMPISPYANSF